MKKILFLTIMLLLLSHNCFWADTGYLTDENVIILPNILYHNEPLNLTVHLCWDMSLGDDPLYFYLCHIEETREFEGINNWGFSQHEFMTEINKHRRNNNVPELQWNSHLAEAALRHSVDMAKNNHFSHTGTDGSTFSERIRASGYPYWPAGENIVAGTRSATQSINAWMASTGHRNNILNSSAVHVGYAYADGYHTMVTGRTSIW